jgi:hypothetical protein
MGQISIGDWVRIALAATLSLSLDDKGRVV